MGPEGGRRGKCTRAEMSRATPSDGPGPVAETPSSVLDTSKSNTPRVPLSQRIRRALQSLAPAPGARLVKSPPPPGPVLVRDTTSPGAIAFRLPPPPPGMLLEQHRRDIAARGGPDARWYPPAAPVTLGPLTIEGGMLYVSKRSPSPAMSWFTSCAIDASLPVSFAPVSMDGIGYYPSYDRLTAQQRGAYLRWLEGGRVDDFENQACLFLFFYGLEHRILGDLDPTTSTAEIRLLYAELAQLAQRFSHRHSFWHYARALLDWLDGLLVCLGVAPPERPESHGPVPMAVMPVMLQLELAAAAKHVLPVAPEVALALVRAHPGARLRTPARRCVEEFNTLFLSRYCQSFPDGLSLSAATTNPLVLSYRPAARGPQWRSIVFHQSALGTTNPAGGVLRLELVPVGIYENEVTITIADLSPVLSVQSFPAPLCGIVEECHMALERYSRYMGTKDADPASAKAQALLPPELRQRPARAATLVNLDVVADLLASDRVTLIMDERLDDQPKTVLTEAPSSSTALVESPPAASGGLDEAHWSLARQLATRELWSRQEAALVANELGLEFLSLALAHINEEALERTGSVLSEGDDPIAVDQQAYQEMTT